MFEENENLVEEETTENTEEEIVEDNGEVDEETQETVENEETAEEEVKEEPQERLYTKEEVDSIKARTKRRIEDKVRKEYEKKYGRAETVLKAGLQKDNFEDAVSELEDYYTQEGVRIPNETKYSQRETEILANAEADDIIESGYDDIVEEVDRLANIGVENMNAGEKIVFNKLAKERIRIEEERDLSSIGVKKEDLPDDFKEFCKKLNPDMPIKDKYEFYLQTRPKKEVRKMGSMESGPVSKVKDYYTAEEIEKLTDEDLDIPGVYEAVRRSMTGQ